MKNGLKTFLVEVIVETETGPKRQTFTTLAAEDWSAQEIAYDMALTSGFATRDDEISFGKTVEKFPSISIKVKRLRDNMGPLPQYMTDWAAGADALAFIEAPITLAPGQRELIPTGFGFEIPIGFEVQVRPRSGLALRHGVSVLNSPGTLDGDYRGEVGVIVINHGTEPFTITPGERIGQLVVTRCWQAEWIEVDELTNTDRGAGGFGHTGRQ